MIPRSHDRAIELVVGHSVLPELLPVDAGMYGVLPAYRVTMVEAVVLRHQSARTASCAMIPRSQMVSSAAVMEPFLRSMLGSEALASTLSSEVQTTIVRNCHRPGAVVSWPAGAMMNEADRFLPKPQQPHGWYTS